jgi:putative metalloenzyme radical SAM/SPASM domain maturase
MQSYATIIDDVFPVPALREYPSKLFVETTSRCNLNCFMCIKQSGGSGLNEGDLSPETFAGLEPAFPQLESLVLNGIGEPLLHPRLEQFIRRARKLMPSESWIGFQSNGVLMTDRRARSLVDAGLDRVCLSLDGVTPATFRMVREGGELGDLERALSALAAAKDICGRSDLQIGVEFVVMRDNLRELPAALRWAASRRADFAIVSHLIPYDEAHAPQALFETSTDAALSLFYAWKVKAEIAGVEIGRYYEVLWKYGRSFEEQRIVDFVEAIRTDARHRNVALDMRTLLRLDWARLDEVLEVFAEAQDAAAEAGLELRLPEAAPRERRRCDFVEEGGAFVSWDGTVHPCHFLWHGCRSAANGWLQEVRPKVFGTLAERGILEIWNSDGFRAFRENVLRYDHPVCSSCTLAPCDYLQAETFAQDCYINQEPCGSCLWCMGMFQCLR